MTLSSPCVVNVGTLEDLPLGTYLAMFPRIADVRRVFGPSSPHIRQKRTQIFADFEQIQLRRKLPLGLYDRMYQYIFAQGNIDTIDPAAIAYYEPYPCKILRQKHLHIHSGEVLDLTTTYKDWNNGAIDNYTILSTCLYVDTLSVEPGAVIQVHSNVLWLFCNEVILTKTHDHNDRENSSQLEIRLLGSEQPSFSVTRRNKAINGVHGQNGLNGYENIQKNMMPSTFGPLAINPVQHLTVSIIDGKNGTAGENGTNGQSGGMVMPGDIRFSSLKNFSPQGVKFFTQAGGGYPGGNGGNGGTGGNGYGNAKPGNGGAGGDAGHGGNGGLSSNIFIDIPKDQRQFITTQSLQSMGGPAGVAGRGGPGGIHITDNSGQSGIAGNDGHKGSRGKNREGAPMYVCSGTQITLPESE